MVFCLEHFSCHWIIVFIFLFSDFTMNNLPKSICFLKCIDVDCFITHGQQQIWTVLASEQNILFLGGCCCCCCCCCCSSSSSSSSSSLRRSADLSLSLSSPLTRLIDRVRSRAVAATSARRVRPPLLRDGSRPTRGPRGELRVGPRFA